MHAHLLKLAAEGRIDGTDIDGAWTLIDRTNRIGGPAMDVEL